MKKLLVLAALAFALVAGTASALIVHPQAAFADPQCSGGNC